MDKILNGFRERRRTLRAVLLGLLIAAVAGPWFFDRVYVPASYYCEIRLEGDYCGKPVSGLYMVGGAFAEMAYRVSSVAAGTTPLIELGRASLLLLIVLLVLAPVFNTLNLIWRENRLRWQVFQMVVCGLAAALVLLLPFSSAEMRSLHLWGLWLYILAVLCALALEIVALRQPSQATIGKE